MIDAFRELKDGEATLLVVEQNFAFARQLGDAVAVMDDGKVAHRGDMASFAADAALQHLRAPFAPTLSLLASAATLPSLADEARERRAIRRLARPGVDPLLAADLFDAAIRAAPRLATALEVRGVRLPTPQRPATALRPSRFGRADLLVILLSVGGLALSVARLVIEAGTLGE